MATELHPRQPLAELCTALISEGSSQWKETHQAFLYCGHQWETAAEDCTWANSERRDHTVKVRPRGFTWWERRALSQTELNLEPCYETAASVCSPATDLKETDFLDG